MQGVGSVVVVTAVNVNVSATVVAIAAWWEDHRASRRVQGAQCARDLG